MRGFCQVFISAKKKKEAERIAKTLLYKKLIAGSLIIKGNARYWWKDKTEKKDYYNVQAFTLMKNKNKIIKKVRKISSEKTPIISFSKIEGNKEFLNWIKNSLK